MKDNILKQVEQFSKEYLLKSNDPSHNFEHIQRVYKLALELAGGEDIDLDVLKISVYLHDIGGPTEVKDKTGKVDHAVEGAKIAEPFLTSLGLPEEKIKHILKCIISHRYRTDSKPESLEAKILFDADKLDSIGAIGIARSYVWVAKNNADMFGTKNIEEYVKTNLDGGTLNGKIIDRTKHSPYIAFETKGKYLADILYTKKAKIIARKRIVFSKKFFDTLDKEISGTE